MEETFSLCSPSTLIRICQFSLFTWWHWPNSDSNSSVSWRQLLLLENVGCDQLPMLFSPPFPSVDLRPILVAFALNFQCCISPNFPSVNDILWWLKPSGLCNLQRFPFTIFEVPRIIHFRTSWWIQSNSKMFRAETSKSWKLVLWVLFKCLTNNNLCYIQSSSLCKENCLHCTQFEHLLCFISWWNEQYTHIRCPEMHDQMQDLFDKNCRLFEKCYRNVQQVLGIHLEHVEVSWYSGGCRGGWCCILGHLHSSQPFMQFITNVYTQVFKPVHYIYSHHKRDRFYCFISHIRGTIVHLVTWVSNAPKLNIWTD